ncbi:MAG: hypothetical protein AAF485_03105 [Chloroflexota bacterium]
MSSVKQTIALSSIILIFLIVAILASLFMIYRGPDLLAQQTALVPTPTLQPVPTSTSTIVPLPGAPTETPIPGPPTPTGTRVVTQLIDPTVTALAQARATIEAENRATVMAKLQTQPQNSFPLNTSSVGGGASGRVDPLVLAHYFAWFDDTSWDDCNMSAGDRPLQPYHSDDPAAIARHVQMGREIGLNGFTLHWFSPGDRTDRNFGMLLDSSRGSDFASSVVFSYHIWHGAPALNHQNVGGALRYIIDQHSQHPNFLNINGRPVIFFTDIYRVPSTPNGQSTQEFWAIVRDQIDPQRQTLWIAEGLDTSYLNVFDGLYVFKTTHAAHPHDFVKSPRWGARVRDWETRTGQAKLWVATITPGWDDLTSGCKPDVRAPAPFHRLDRANGAIYQASFESAVSSNPDWLIVGSFNEWVEGSYIEPGVLFGDRYMHMTREFVQQFQQK